jgi:hypothetical protein
MKIKAVVRNHYISIRMAKIKVTSPNSGENEEKPDLLECKIVQLPRHGGTHQQSQHLGDRGRRTTSLRQPGLYGECQTILSSIVRSLKDKKIK